MFRQLSKTWVWLLLPASAIVFFVAATLYYYDGLYNPPPDATVRAEDIELATYASSVFNESPVIRQGVLLVDNSHRNRFSEEELNTLLSRVADRGYSVEFTSGRDQSSSGQFFSPFGFPAPFSGRGSQTVLDESLRKADSLAVILPNTAYTPDEVAAVQRFVRKGGTLLLIGDPSRPSEINCLAEPSGFQFQDGYLYNLVEHNLNFRNIIVRDFRPDPVTSGLNDISLYWAGAIKTSGVPLAFTDTNTLSSMVERLEPFSPLAKSSDGRVLAISDMTFLEPPRNSTLDNDRLIANIADFLTTGERGFELADFPHFFGEDVDILLGDASLFNIGSQMRSLLSDAQMASEVRGVEDLDKDTVFLGLYQDALAVAQYLDAAGVQIDGTIRTPFTPDIAAGGTAVVLLHEGRNRRVLVVLGDSPFALLLIVDQLESGRFRDGLVNDFLGVYQVR